MFSAFFFRFKQLSKKLQHIQTIILLNFVYFLGIGSTSLVAKVAKKRFLSSTDNSSNWKKYTSSQKIEMMY